MQRDKDTRSVQDHKISKLNNLFQADLKMHILAIKDLLLDLNALRSYHRSPAGGIITTKHFNSVVKEFRTK